MVLIILFSLIGSSIFIPNSSAQEETKIPNWIKNVAGWWATGEVSEKEFLSGLEYLINNNIIFIPFIPCSVTAIAASDPTLNAKLIPDWVKNNAGWWATDQIGDADFINGIEYLIKTTILGIDNESVQILATNLEKPWAIDFADDKIFVTEKVGRVRVIESGVLLDDPLSNNFKS